MAKPMKPSTGAASRSQWSTLSSEAPRPSSTLLTFSRPSPLRAWSESICASSRVSTPSIFQMSTSTPSFWKCSIDAAHQLGAQLGVVAVGVAADGLQLGVLGRDEQLEEELAVVGVQPVRELLQALGLALVHLGVAVRVVTDEHLGGEQVVLLDVGGEVVAVLEVELVLAGLLGRHRQREALLGRQLGDVGAELLVDQHAGRGGVEAALDGLLHALVDQLLGVGDRLGLLGRRVALDPEHLLLERPPVVEGQDVELAVVTEGHRSLPRVVVLNREARTLRGHMEPKFSGPAYTVGIEEELMILDPDTYALVNAIDDLLEDSPDGEIKPELMESVLEISTKPCADMREAAAALRALRRQVRDIADKKGLLIGSAGTHPLARWEDQRITAAPRYRDLVDALRFVARQEIIFGLHVHIGLDDPDKAIHVANGMRVHVPILLALSANSPFWRGDDSGLASTRMPIFRAFPRVGIPPYYDGWDDYERADRLHGRGRRDGGLHLALVRRPPAPELRHGRDPGDGRADPRRAHARRWRR